MGQRDRDLGDRGAPLHPDHLLLGGAERALDLAQVQHPAQHAGQDLRQRSVLDHVVRRTGAQRLGGELLAAVGRDHDDRGAELALVDLAQHVEAGARALEHVVEQDDVGLRRQAERGVAAGDAAQVLESGERREALEHAHHGGVVLDDQHPHGQPVAGTDVERLGGPARPVHQSSMNSGRTSDGKWPARHPSCRRRCTASRPRGP